MLRSLLVIVLACLGLSTALRASSGAAANVSGFYNITELGAFPFSSSNTISLPHAHVRMEVGANLDWNIVAYSLTDVSVLWKTKVYKSQWLSGCNYMYYAADAGVLFQGGCTYGDDGGQFPPATSALNASTGAILWQLGNLAKNGIIYQVTPICATDEVLVSYVNGDNLYYTGRSIKTGELLWTAGGENPFFNQTYDNGRCTAISTPSKKAPKGIVVVFSIDGQAFGLRADSGAKLWENDDFGKSLVLSFVPTGAAPTLFGMINESPQQPVLVDALTGAVTWTGTDVQGYACGVPYLSNDGSKGFFSCSRQTDEYPFLVCYDLKNKKKLWEKNVTVTKNGWNGNDYFTVVHDKYIFYAEENFAWDPGFNLNLADIETGEVIYMSATFQTGESDGDLIAQVLLPSSPSTVPTTVFASNGTMRAVFEIAIGVTCESLKDKESCSKNAGQLRCGWCEAQGQCYNTMADTCIASSADCKYADYYEAWPWRAQRCSTVKGQFCGGCAGDCVSHEKSLLCCPSAPGKYCNTSATESCCGEKCCPGNQVCTDQAGPMRCCDDYCCGLSQCGGACCIVCCSDGAGCC